MSRFYVRTFVDDKEQSSAKRANKKIRTRVYYGSADNSKLAAELTVTWPSGEVLPSVIINDTCVPVREK